MGVLIRQVRPYVIHSLFVNDLKIYTTNVNNAKETVGVKSNIVIRVMAEFGQKAFRTQFF